MSEELRAREQAARREYPQTSAAFDRIRARAIDKLIATKPEQHEKREELYRLVHILDSVQSELLEVCGQGSEDIEKYIQSLNSEATTGNR